MLAIFYVSYKMKNGALAVQCMFAILGAGSSRAIPI
jgi:hypothetical protein